MRQAEVHLHLHQAGIVDVILDAGPVQRHGAGSSTMRAGRKWRSVSGGMSRAVSSRPPSRAPAAHSSRAPCQPPKRSSHLPPSPRDRGAGHGTRSSRCDACRRVRPSAAPDPRTPPTRRRWPTTGSICAISAGMHRGHGARGAASIQGTVHARRHGVAARYQEAADLVAVVEVAIVGAARGPGA